MRTIRFTSRFKKDYNKIQNGLLPKSLEVELKPVVEILTTDQTLPERYRDHALRGDRVGFRDCHVRPDLVLIYRKIGADALEFSRLGSHSDLFKK